MSTVLLVGEDERLLQTRAAVVRMTGAETVCSGAASALAIQTDRKCSVVVLCHSLPEEVRAELAQAIRDRWPETRILQVTSERVWGRADAEAMMDSVSSADPERLMRLTAELLRKDVARSRGETAKAATISHLQ